MTRILVTGASGFVGRRLCARLVRDGHAVRAQVRTSRALAGVEALHVTGDLTALVDAAAWAELVAGCTAVVHLAARTHAGDAADAAAAQGYEATNVTVTRALAQAAREAGVRDFVFLSSIKVNGERSAPDNGSWRALGADDPPRPEDLYGQSKWRAEQVLAAARGPMRVTILRPPLLYGPGVKANLLRLCGAVARGRPLPFASIANRRSLLAVDNLVDAVLCALARAPDGLRVYTLADLDCSTPDLVRVIAQALDVEPRLWPCPVGVLRVLGRLGGRRAAIARLTDSLVVDRARIAEGLAWRPPVSAADAWAATAAWYRTEHGRP